MKKALLIAVLFVLEAPPGFEPGDKGFADPCLTAWLWRLLGNEIIIICFLSYVKQFFVFLLLYLLLFLNITKFYFN